MRKLIFAAIFLFLLPLVIADDLYDSFDDGNLNNNYFSYIRDTCDGGDARSGGSLADRRQHHVLIPLNHGIWVSKLKIYIIGVLHHLTLQSHGILRVAIYMVLG